MFQTSASAKAKKYGNFNFVQKDDSTPKLTSVQVEGSDRGGSISGHYGAAPNISKQQLVIIGVSLDHLSRSKQLFICCTGVFAFYLVYGYLQVGLSQWCFPGGTPSPHLFYQWNGVPPAKIKRGGTPFPLAGIKYEWSSVNTIWHHPNNFGITCSTYVLFLAIIAQRPN